MPPRKTFLSSRFSYNSSKFRESGAETISDKKAGDDGPRQPTATVLIPGNPLSIGLGCLGIPGETSFFVRKYGYGRVFLMMAQPD